jgi:hypothetical protein
LATTAPSFHRAQVLDADRVNVAGHGDEHVADLRGFGNGHHAVAIHYRLDGARSGSPPSR